MQEFQHDVEQAQMFTNILTEHKTDDVRYLTGNSFGSTNTCTILLGLQLCVERLLEIVNNKKKENKSVDNINVDATIKEQQTTSVN